MRRWLTGCAASLIALASCGSVAAGSQPWQSEGPTGASFLSLDQAPDGSILGGTREGLHRYREATGVWEPVGLDGLNVSAILASSVGVLFASTSTSGCVTVYSHAVSFDDGQTWSDADGLPFPARTSAIAETPDGTVWMGLTSGELYRWDPGATRWSRHFPMISAYLQDDLAVTAGGSLLVVAGTVAPDQREILRSEDGGQTWSIPLVAEIESGTVTAGPRGLAVAAGRKPSPGGVTFFFSFDDGRSWIERPCSDEACASMAGVDVLAVLDDGTVAAAGPESNGTAGRLIVAGPRGEPWRLAARYASTPSALLTDRDGALWVAGIAYAWRSTDTASTFEHVADGLVTTSVTGLATSSGSILAVAGSHAIAGWSGLVTIPGVAGVHASTDGGTTWAPTAVWQANSITSGLTGAALAATDWGVQRSTDGGATWLTVPGTGDRRVKAVVEDRTGALCLVSIPAALQCSDDGGASWHGDLGLGARGGELAATPDGTFLAEANEVVYRSVDGGRSWLPTALTGDVRFFAVSPEGRVVASIQSDSAEVAVSDDSGLSWGTFEVPYPNPSAMVFHPAWGPIVGYRGGTYYSPDRLRSWRLIELPGLSLTLHGDRLVTGSQREGAWLAELPSRARRSSGRTRP